MDAGRYSPKRARVAVALERSGRGDEGGAIERLQSLREPQAA